MGMGIMINTSSNVTSDIDNYEPYSLSSKFLRLIAQDDVGYQNKELIQIGKLIDLDISLIQEMYYYPSDEELETNIEFADNQNEIDSYKAIFHKRRKKYDSNINLVIKTVNILIDRLIEIENWQDKINYVYYGDRYGTNRLYFSDFNPNEEKGNVEPNFGQDLRNIRRFLDLANLNEEKTVFFQVL